MTGQEQERDRTEKGQERVRTGAGQAQDVRRKLTGAGRAQETEGQDWTGQDRSRERDL
jgi:hypothetical protein